MSIDYANRDYATIRNDLLDRASVVLPEWTDRDPSDFGMLLVDLWAYMGDVLHYYVDRAVQEKFSATATQRESLVSLANLFDYQVSSRTSARGTLTLRNSGDADQVVGGYTQFVARYDNKTYKLYTISGGIVPAGGDLELEVYEGTVVREEVLTLSASGNPSQRYTLENTNVVHDVVYIDVYENYDTPVQYSRVVRLGDYGTDRKVFKLNSISDNSTEVVFGTGAYGYPPPVGSKITATYAYSSGSLGNIAAGSVVGFLSETPAGVSVVSSSTMSGGSDEESIESLRSSISSSIYSQNRAVTKTDFANMAKQVNGVAKVSVGFSPNPAGGASAGNAVVTVYAHPQISDEEYVSSTDTSASVSTVLTESVVDYVQPKAVLGVDVECASTISWSAIDVSLTLVVADGYVRRWVSDAVEHAVKQLFYFSKVSYGQRMTLGQLYRTVLNVDGVDYCTVSLFNFNGASGDPVQPYLEVSEHSLPKMGTLIINPSGGVTSS